MISMAILCCPAHLGHIRQDLIAVAVEQHDALVEVVVLHGGGGVQPGQTVAGLDLVAVVGSPVVEVMTEAGDHHGQTLNLSKLLPPGRVGDDGEHQLKSRLVRKDHWDVGSHLADVEGVSPVVVGDTPVVAADRAEPPANIHYQTVTAGQNTGTCIK